MPPISPTIQAAIRPIWEVTPKLLGHDTVTVAVQHIALARIDTQDGNKARRVVLNLYGTRDIDRLIVALSDAKARMQREQDLLNQIMGRKSEAIAAETTPPAFGFLDEINTPAHRCTDACMADDRPVHLHNTPPTMTPAEYIAEFS